LKHIVNTSLEFAKRIALYLLIGFSFVVVMLVGALGTNKSDYLSTKLIPDNLDHTNGQSVMALLVALIVGALVLEAIQFYASRGQRYRSSTVARLLSKPVIFLCAFQNLYWWLGTPPKAEGERFVIYAYAAVAAVAFIATRWGYLKPRYQQQAAPAPVQGQEEQADVGNVSRPTTSFKDIYGYAEIKDRIKDAANEIVKAGASKKQARNGILLHGGPGNGKTAFAEALAGEFRLPLVTMTLADVESKWVGEKAQRVSAAFETAKRNAPCVFFIDEIDSLMSERSNAGSGVAETQNNGVVNALLTLMVDLRKSKVILVAATNYMDRLDSAGVREGRFDFKIEITTPDLEARVGLLKKGLQMNVPHIKAAPDVVEMVAQRWNGFSAKRILAVTEELPSYLKRNELRTLGFDEFMGALRSIQGRKGVKLENVKPLSELVWPHGRPGAHREPRRHHAHRRAVLRRSRHRQDRCCQSHRQRDRLCLPAHHRLRHGARHQGAGEALRPGHGDAPLHHLHR